MRPLAIFGDIVVANDRVDCILRLHYNNLQQYALLSITEYPIPRASSIHCLVERDYLLRRLSSDPTIPVRVISR